MYLSSLSVIDRIRKLEDKRMERKSSFRYDHSIVGASKDQEKQISKALAGFMNAEGGILYIGVDNKGNVLGLKNDYSLVKDKNADGFQLELRNSINHFLKKKMISGLIDIKFHPLNGEEICEISIHNGCRLTSFLFYII
jgi:predicted HTH transcriptional regulator